MRTFWRTSSSVTKENCYLQNSDKEVSKIEKPQCSQNNPSALPLRQTVTFLYNPWNTYKELVSHISRIVSSALQIFSKPDRKQKQHTHTAAEPGQATPCVLCLSIASEVRGFPLPQAGKAYDAYNNNCPLPCQLCID